jgi:chemotaxis protein CheZ
VRRLAELVRRRLGQGGTLYLTESDIYRPDQSDAAPISAAERRRLDQLAREVGQVAEYVTRLKREIRFLKAGEVHSKQIPETVTDLRSVHSATKSAADSIMAAAEAIMERDVADPAYGAFVLDRVTEIMEACSFEDLTGQRLDRALTTLGEVEARLERFTKAVKIADAADRFDRKAILREARREVLLVEGPQDADVAVKQTDIDKLFD